MSTKTLTRAAMGPAMSLERKGGKQRTSTDSQRRDLERVTGDELEELHLGDSRRDSRESPASSIRGSFGEATAPGSSLIGSDGDGDGEQRLRQWRQWKPQGVQALDRDPWLRSKGRTSSGRSSLTMSRHNSMQSLPDEMVSRQSSRRSVSGALPVSRLTSLAQSLEGEVSRQQSASMDCGVLKQGSGYSTLGELPQLPEQPCATREVPKFKVKAGRSSLFMPTAKEEMQVMQKLLYDHGIEVQQQETELKRSSSWEGKLPPSVDWRASSFFSSSVEVGQP